MNQIIVILVNVYVGRTTLLLCKVTKQNEMTI